ncbi:hypothetical protein [Dactylosporangium sp. NPDC051484]|uniref:DUF6907 domain-containing protein n=1 Tax=Dactylosporangium sp. NPDC051484 TaxID=3154942 RepID=UPI00344F5112
MSVTQLPGRQAITVEHAPASVLPFQARCPSWCTIERDDPHETHLRATGAISVQPTPGQLNLITVMVKQDRDGAAVDLRVLPHADQYGALLDAEALDQVIAALTEARQCIAGRATPNSVAMAPRRRQRQRHS